MKIVDSMSAPLKAMGGELAALESELKSERKELAQMEAALRSLNKASVVDISTSRQLRDQITAKKDAVAGLVHRQVQLGGVTKTVEKDVSKMGRTFASSASEAASADSALSGMGAELGAMLNPVTLLTAAVLGLGAGFGYLLAKGVSMSLSARQAKDDVEDSLSLILDTQDAVESTYDGLSDIADKLGAPIKDTQKLAQSLVAAGVTSKDALLDATEAITTASKISDDAGSKIQNIIAKAGASGVFQINGKMLKSSGVTLQDYYASLSATTGKGVEELKQQLKAGKITADVGISALTAAVDKKLGGKAREKATGFDESITRIGNKVTQVFENVDIKPFEDALSRVVDLFDESGDQAGLVKDIFDSVFRALAAAVPYAEGLLLGVELALLNIYNATYPLRQAIKDAFGGTSLPSVESMDDALILVADAVGWVTTQLSELLAHKVVLYAIAAAAAAVVVPMLVLAAIPYAIVAAFVALIAVGARVESWLLGLGSSAITAGGNIVSGLIDGLLAAGPKLVNAVKGLATEAIASFKKTFGIASPSKVMMGVGADLGLGLGLGLEKESPADTLRDEAQASRDAVEAEASGDPSSRFPELSPSSPAPAAAGATGGQGRPSVTVTFPNMVVQITGVKDAESVAPSMMQALGDLMEQAGLTLGTRPAGSGDEEAA